MAAPPVLLTRGRWLAKYLAERKDDAGIQRVESTPSVDSRTRLTSPDRLWRDTLHIPKF